jgi:hypothetical protein
VERRTPWRDEHASGRKCWLVLAESRNQRLIWEEVKQVLLMLLLLLLLQAMERWKQRW